MYSRFLDDKKKMVKNNEGKDFFPQVQGDPKILQSLWNRNCENSRTQFLAILRFPRKWVRWYAQTYSIQPATKIVVMRD